MSRRQTRTLQWFGIGGGGVGCLAILVTVGLGVPNPRAPKREITLVAREMAFYLAGEDTPNPALQFSLGERVRLTLINHDPGMLHDLVIPEWGLTTAKLEYGEADALVFHVGGGRTTEYLCSLHPATMRGAVSIMGQAENRNP